jgi:hypothetical protein
VAALLVGLKPEMCKPELVGLVGRDTETGATWPFPPTLFLSVQLDHAVILLNMRHTIAYFLERVRAPRRPPSSRAYPSLALRTSVATTQVVCPPPPPPPLRAGRLPRSDPYACDRPLSAEHAAARLARRPGGAGGQGSTTCARARGRARS